MREALVTFGIENAGAPRNSAWPATDHPVVQGLGCAGPDRRLPRAGAPLRLSAASGPDRSRHGQQGHRRLDRRAVVLLQEGIGDTIRISLTPEPGGDRTQRSRGCAGDPADHGPAQVHADGDRLPGCGRTTSTFFQELADRIQTYLREQMPEWRRSVSGRRSDERRRDGLRRQRPGRIKHANIGISLPGTGESPAAPVFVDGESTVTLKGERIAEEFQAIVDDYVRRKLRRRIRRTKSYVRHERSPPSKA